MLWVFAVIGLVAVVLIGLVVVGGETARLAQVARPAVFDLAEAVVAGSTPDFTEAVRADVARRVGAIPDAHR